MKIIVSLLITKNIENEEEIREYTKNISSYINSIDRLYIYNVTKYGLDKFFDELARYENIEYVNCSDLGEASNYDRMMKHAEEVKADYNVILELGYYYEEDVFATIKKYIIEHPDPDIAIYTPTPLYGCQLHERKAEKTRYVMGGCKLIGTFVNVNIYTILKGFKLEYYQSTFDYEYCIRARLAGYKILLFNNEVLRNINYRIIEKKIGFTTVSTYDKDPLDIYYEYRNRLYLWEEYKKLDPYYVKLDKKLAKAERHEMKWRDKGYRDKLVMFEKAKDDYKRGIVGQIQYGKKEIKY